MTSALRTPPTTLPRQAALVQVPFVPQEDYQCGPAALAMALASAGAGVAVEQLVSEVYLPARQGSLQLEMLATARRHARLAALVPARLDAVLAEVAAGHPVVVLQNLSLPFIPRWHYAVVIGFDLERQDILLHSGTTARLTLSMAVFERTWARSGYWAMVVTAPDTLPVTLDAPSLVSAAAALERIDPKAASGAFAALTQRHPALYGAWFGLGNARHASGDLAGSLQAFESATRIDPQAADAWNNRALVELALGRLDDARGSAQRAVALGGPRADRYRATLDAVARARDS